MALIGLLTVYSCKQQTSKGPPPVHSGLLIDNGINRGTNYTDSVGIDHNLRYIPISITNDSIIPIRLQITFSKEYEFPHPDSDEKFKVIPLPNEWALDGVGVTESMIDELPKYIGKPVLNEIVQPGEELVMAIGTLYPRPPKTSGVLPNELFVHIERGIFPACDWLMQGESSSNNQILLGLRLNFGEKCVIILCGQISYADQ